MIASQSEVSQSLAHLGENTIRDSRGVAGEAEEKNQSWGGE